MPEEKTESIPVIACEKNGVAGWKCGSNGTCHIGLEGKQRAIRECKKLNN